MQMPVMFIFLLPLQQGDGEFASLAWLAFHIEHSIMLKNDLTCDGEADAKSAVEFVAAFFEMEEAVEEMFEDERTEEWKRTAGLSTETDSERVELEHDPLYVLGNSFTVASVRWCGSLPGEVKEDAGMRTVMEHLMIPAMKIAGALAVDGDAEAEKEILGLRLANYKRGLHAANIVLNCLSDAREKGLIASESVFPIIKQATELRNAIAVRILDVREQFNGL